MAPHFQIWWTLYGIPSPTVSCHEEGVTFRAKPQDILCKFTVTVDFSWA